MNTDSFENKRCQDKKCKISIGTKLTKRKQKNLSRSPSRRKKFKKSKILSPPSPHNTHAHENVFRSSNDAIRGH